MLVGPIGAVVTVVNWGGLTNGILASLHINRTAAGFDGLDVDKVVDAWSGQSLNVSSAPSATIITIPIIVRDANFIAVYAKNDL